MPSRVSEMLNRKNYTVIGDHVNVASGLESLCKTYGRRGIVSEAMLDRLGKPNRYRFAFPGEASAKGKELPVRIYGLGEDRRRERWRTCSFLAIGDGSPAHKAVVACIVAHQTKDPFNLALLLGDNFYEDGVQTPLSLVCGYGLFRS